MELLFVTLGGAILGLAARYLLPRRETHGALLAPSIGAAAASVVWAVLTWAGMKFDGGWIWWVSFLIAAAVSVVATLVIGRLRHNGDAQLLARLSRA